MCSQTEVFAWWDTIIPLCKALEFLDILHLGRSAPRAPQRVKRSKGLWIGEGCGGGKGKGKVVRAKLCMGKDEQIVQSLPNSLKRIKLFLRRTEKVRTVRGGIPLIRAPLETKNSHNSGAGFSRT